MHIGEVLRVFVLLNATTHNSSRMCATVHIPTTGSECCSTETAPVNMPIPGQAVSRFSYYYSGEVTLLRFDTHGKHSINKGVPHVCTCLLVARLVPGNQETGAGHVSSRDPLAIFILFLFASSRWGCHVLFQRSGTPEKQDERAPMGSSSPTQRLNSMVPRAPF